MNTLPEAVWMPDACAKEEIDRRAKVYAWGEVVDGSTLLRGTVPKYNAVVYGHGSIGMFQEGHQAFSALEQHIAKYVNVYNITQEQIAKGVERATLEVATSCVEEYDAWQSGDCHMLVACYYTKTDDGWERVATDYIGGFVGSEWAAEGVWEHVPSEYQRPAV